MRVIARLDIKGEYLVKGIHLEGLRKLGNPNEYAKKYYHDGIDEIIYMDIVASLYNRNSLLDLVKSATENIFVPITVGGGIRTLRDVEKALNSGADKIAINTAAIKNPQIINDIAKEFGSQCMVASIEAKKTHPNTWEAYYDNGREKSGLNVLSWAKQVCDLGAGEILLTSVDQEGTTRGMDLELIQQVTNLLPIPVISSGGIGSIDDFNKASIHADAICIAHALHYNKININNTHESLRI